MKFLLLVALLASSVLASPSSLVRQRRGARIIGGSDALAGQYPYAAAINTQTNEGTYFCGGALLNQQWIVTSGSCVDGVLLFIVRLGSNNLNGNDAGALRLSTDIYFLHPEYNPATLDADIGLIELRSPITFTDYIQPIGLPTRDLQPYAVVYAIGWGQVNDEDGGLVDHLQNVVLTALSNEECRLYFGSQITDNMVCVEGNYNEGTCHGDTGTPLIQFVNGHQATLAGVSSFLSGNGCETTDPSGFTRSFPYLEWITNHTQAVV